MGELTGLVAVVTGGSRGFGRAAAEAFAREGASVAICARTPGPLAEAAREIAARHGVEVFHKPMDILDPASVEAFAEAVGAELGGADILVNNAGESSQRALDGVSWPVNAVDSPGQELPPGRFEKMQDHEFREAFEQKCLGMIRVTRSFLPMLRRSGAASIVNITSIKGQQPPPRVVTSGIAWAAAMNFSKGLSLELAGDRIRVNIVSVGGILTPQMEAGRQRWAPEKTLDEFLAKRVQNIPLKRLGTSEEVAEAILFLGSPRSAYVTGQILSIDGGGLRGL
jgi:NAD(P)-dependent dehydrogenase (short-subunit alcohol dehydrogenase family)